MQKQTRQRAGLGHAAVCVVQHQPWSKPDDESRSRGVRSRPGQRKITTQWWGSSVGGSPGRGWGPEHARDSLACLPLARFSGRPSRSASLCLAGTPSYSDTTVGANPRLEGLKLQALQTLTQYGEAREAEKQVQG